MVYIYDTWLLFSRAYLYSPVLGKLFTAERQLELESQQGGFTKTVSLRVQSFYPLSLRVTFSDGGPTLTAVEYLV